MLNPLMSVAANGFEAARQLAHAADCRARLHGHSFRVEAASGTLDTVHLAHALQAAVSPLNYTDLNRLITEPDDLSLAQHLHQATQGAAIRLQSAPGRGADLTDQGEQRVWLRVDFAAAHYLPQVAAGHKCGRLHGHTFGVKLTAKAPAHDHAALERAWLPLYLKLNHAYLNDIAGLENPTSEVLAGWIWQQLQPALPELHSVTVYETATAGSRFDGQRYRIWKEQRFESAVPFDASGRYTGHSYRVALHLAGALDTVMGWVEDFGDVKAHFKPIYEQLDHHPLDRLDGIQSTDCAGISQWIVAQARPLLPHLCRVDLYAGDDTGVRDARHTGAPSA